MNKTLILVESPTKARTLYRFLKGKYDIQASMGHIRDLPKGELGVDVQDNFSPKYVIPKDKRKTVENLKSMAKEYSNIILATDPDREGEAIAYHLRFILKKEIKKDMSFKRIVFHEITQTAINEAMEHSRDIDQNLVNAQTARRILDRIVGYKLSPLLWKKVKRNLSAGRVQSVVVRLVVEREREIEKFSSEPYFKISVLLLKNSTPIEFELIEVNGNKVEQTIKVNLYDGEYKYTKTNIDQKDADEIAKDLKTGTYRVVDVITKETRRSPYPPYITSSLQQDGSRRLHYSSKRTMSVAQKLYEEGYITYHRTDSFNLSKQFIFGARKFIESKFGKQYLPEKPRFFKTKSKVAQEAHEAIRPTSMESKKDDVMKELGRDHARLYELIYNRAIATQMADALFESTKILVERKNNNNNRHAEFISASQTNQVSANSNGIPKQVRNDELEVQDDKKSNTYLFEKNGSVLKFDGFLKLTGTNEENDLLPVIQKDEVLPFQDAKIKESKTNPPSRYSEASLIATLEKNGIGRPSTYAPIISTVEERNYIERSEGRFVPTFIGITVNDFLVRNFPNIDDIPFTAGMENQLDEIAQGNKEWVPMISGFYKPFEEKITEAEKDDKVKIPEEKTGRQCPQCGNDIVIRLGKFGKFYACSNFPKCTYKENYQEKVDAVCPKDGGTIVIKKTRKGRRFYGCSNYPNCNFAVWKLKDMEKDIKTN